MTICECVSSAWMGMKHLIPGAWLRKMTSVFAGKACVAQPDLNTPHGDSDKLTNVDDSRMDVSPTGVRACRRTSPLPTSDNMRAGCATRSQTCNAVTKTCIEHDNASKSCLHPLACIDWMCMDNRRELEYAERLASFRVAAAPLQTHHGFCSQLASMPGVTAQSSKRRAKAIATDLASLAHALPIHIESSIHVVVDENRNDILRFLILPAQDTPYANGAFIFDALLPLDYPDSSPKVKFLTTGAGRIRFNPNLYCDGTVCLSLLGTWAGPGWQPGTSTLLQVLVSISALVFTSDPYFLEPGYEAARGSDAGMRASAEYSRRVWQDTVSTAILKPLQNPEQQPHCVFRDVLTLHFRNKRGSIMRALEQRPVTCSAEVLRHLDALTVPM